VLRTTAVGGGGVRGGSVVHCSWAVRPYLDDARHGTRVLLTPEHYDLRSATASVSTTPDRTGWTLGASGPSGTARFDLEYEVADRATGDVVLRQKATMTCGAEGVAQGPAPQAPAPQAVASVVWGEADAPALGDHVVAYQPPPPVAPECRWGRGLGGCKEDPLGWATVSGVLALAFTGASVGSISAGFARRSDLPKMVGVLLGLPAVATTTVFAVGMHAHQHPQGLAAVSPSVAFTSKGASLGVALSF
jgi:hypothetical protein